MRRLYAADPEKFRRRSNDYYAANREVLNERSKDWKARNHEYVLDYAKAYREKNHAKTRAASIAWLAANPDAGRRYQAAAREDLRDSYVRRVIFDNKPAPMNVPQWLIDLKREQIRLRRLAKELRQEVINQQEKTK
jgi:hypothetical protein